MPSERNEFANHPVAMPQHSHRSVAAVAIITQPKDPSLSLAPPSEHRKSRSPWRRCCPRVLWAVVWKTPARSSYCQSGRVRRCSRKEVAGVAGGGEPRRARRVVFRLSRYSLPRSLGWAGTACLGMAPNLSCVAVDNWWCVSGASRFGMKSCWTKVFHLRDY